MQPATAKWYDRRDSVFVEFCVEDSKDVQLKFDKLKFDFSCLNGADKVKLHNTVDLFGEIDPKGSKHRRTDRSVLCCLRKAEAGKSWPRLTKDKSKCNWLSVDFNNWKDWEDESDEDLSSFDKFSEVRMPNMYTVKIVSTFSYTAQGTCGATFEEAMTYGFFVYLQMMNTMGGDDLPDLDAADEEHGAADSDDEKMPDLE
ncbi:prostaglandin E synthase 3 isoform X1 [Labrus bergylta]|uniref:prostaglandin E synthase 3 isoform X1 n=1 Tax=Labrus bergylta TaxID=56723 RepID=UPI0009B47E72|nr:prostaglandin E synthase 3-like isoform X1 [Labrus bergylta]